MKYLVLAILFTNSLMFPQISKYDLLEEAKERGNIKVTELESDIYLFEYPEGTKRYVNLGKTETHLLDSIPTTRIEVWTLDTMLYKDMYYFWQEVLVSTSSEEELVIADANRNNYPEIYGYKKDYEDPSIWMPTHIYEMDSTGIFTDKYTYPDSIIHPQNIFDVDRDANLELYLNLIDGRHIFYAKEYPKSLPLEVDFLFNSYPGQLNDTQFGDFDKNGLTDFLFYDLSPKQTVICEYNPFTNNFDTVIKFPYATGFYAGYAIGDFDEDGKTNIVYGSLDGEVFVIEAEAEHNYSLVWQTDIMGYHSYMQIFTNDIDGNGKPEFWISCTTYNGVNDITRFTCFEYIGDNEYDEKCRIDFVGVFPIYASNAFASDVNNDGKEELVICISNYIFIMQFRGSNEKPAYEIFYMARNNLPGGFYGVTMYDLDNDGDEELLIHRGVTRNDGKTKDVTHIFIPDFVVPVDEDELSTFSDYRLEQNYPNPFNPVTNISYSLPVRTEISLKVFDVLGNEIAVLDEGEKSSGNYTVEWNGKDKFQNNVSSGIYFIHLGTPFYNKTIKGVMLK